MGQRSASPLLTLTRVCRFYINGEERTAALRNISLNFYPGEMVALMGPSGSGKSTLLNILGCLDSPSEGSYCINGQDISGLDSNALAWLRKKYFGFIFQRYQLIPGYSALDNVALPGIYAGMSRQVRQDRAKGLLARLGLASRWHSRPTQLSGGQQQRVSIARALMNGGRVILADEPTGALDSTTGGEVMSILRELAARGYTIIVVTHDPQVAEKAHRIIQIADGNIVSDKPNAGRENMLPGTLTQEVMAPAAMGFFSTLSETFKMAVRAILSQPLRALLTSLGIMAGIAAVACVVGLGEGAKDKVLGDIQAMGYNVFTVYPGTGWGSDSAREQNGLTELDAETAGLFAGVRAASPLIYGSTVINYANRKVETYFTGVNEHYLAISDRQVVMGRGISTEDIASNRAVIVIDENVRQSLFHQWENPLGHELKINRFVAKIVGVVRHDGFERRASAWLPFRLIQERERGAPGVDAVLYRVKEGADKRWIQSRIKTWLKIRHNGADFFIHSLDDVARLVERSTATLTLLILSVAAVALLIGGTGVMNMMLVSVTERTREIGIRLALGASRRDIKTQFLCEALIICLASGVAGIALSAIISAVTPVLLDEFPVNFSLLSVSVATLCSTLTGLIFGYLPAQRAARMTPVSALARE